MKNTIENKAKLFAKYIGQKVFLEPFNEPNLKYLYGVTGNEFLISDGAAYELFEILRLDECIENDIQTVLFLRPLSSITDDEAIEVAKIGLPDKVLYDYLWIPGTGKAIANSIDKGRQTNTFYPHFRFIDTADYLRSKGFALPYMGLSVETMVEYGWIKLTPLAPNL